MGNIKSIFIIMLMFVMGGSLIGSVNTSFTAVTTPTYDSSVAALKAVPVLVFMMLIILKGFDSI